MPPSRTQRGGIEASDSTPHSPSLSGSTRSPRRRQLSPASGPVAIRERMDAAVSIASSGSSDANESSSESFPPALGDSKNPTCCASQNAGHVFGLRRRERNERSQIVRGARIDPVEHERVEMRRQVERRPEALDESDRPILSTLNPGESTCPSSLVGKQRTQKGAKDLRREPRIPGTAVAEWIGKCEEPTDEREQRESRDRQDGRQSQSFSDRRRKGRIYSQASPAPPITRRRRADRIRMRRSERARTHGRAHRIRGTPGSLAPRTGRPAHPALAPERGRARVARDRLRVERSSRVHGVRIRWRRGVHRDRYSSSDSKPNAKTTMTRRLRRNGSAPRSGAVHFRSLKRFPYRVHRFTGPTGPCGLLVAH